MTNVEKCKKLGILTDLLENNTEERINKWDAEEILDAWLEWQGIIGWTTMIVKIYDAFRDAPDLPDEDCAEYELCRGDITETDFVEYERRVAGDLIDFDLPTEKKPSMFRDLTPEEEATFREWPRENYTPWDKIDPMWHPVIQDECNKINQENFDSNDKD